MASIQWQYVAIIAISMALMLLVYLLLEKTFIGQIMQATAQDQYMSSMVGVTVISSVGLTFALSATITGICGGLLAPIFFLNNTMGATAGAKAFAAIVIGGFGSVPGAILGGVIVGLVEQFGGAYISSTYQMVLIYVVLIIFLMFRPADCSAKNPGKGMRGKGCCRRNETEKPRARSRWRPFLSRACRWCPMSRPSI